MDETTQRQTQPMDDDPFNLGSTPMFDDATNDCPLPPNLTFEELERELVASQNPPPLERASPPTTPPPSRRQSSSSPPDAPTRGRPAPRRSRSRSRSPEIVQRRQRSRSRSRDCAEAFASARPAQPGKWAFVKSESLEHGKNYSSEFQTAQNVAGRFVPMETKADAFELDRAGAEGAEAKANAEASASAEAKILLILANKEAVTPAQLCAWMPQLETRQVTAAAARLIEANKIQFELDAKTFGIGRYLIAENTPVRARPMSDAFLAEAFELMRGLSSDQVTQRLAFLTSF